MRRKTKAIIAVTLAACMTLSSTVLAFAEGGHVDTVDVKSDVNESTGDNGSFEREPQGSVYVNNITSESCEINTLGDPSTNYTENYVIDDSTKVTIDGKEAAQTGTREETWDGGSITYYTYSIASSSEDSDPSEPETKPEGETKPEEEPQPEKETQPEKQEEQKSEEKAEDKSDDSKKDNDDDDNSNNATQFTTAPQTAATTTIAAVTEGKVTTAAVDPSSADYSAKVVELIAGVPANGSLDLNITNSAYLDAAIITALATRSDVSVNLTVTFMGVPHKLTIPAGYNLLALMGADGKIDFVKLIETFPPKAK